MKKLWILVVSLALLTSIALSQSVATSVPASREDIVKLFATMKVREQTHKTLDAMLAQQRAMVKETMRKRHPNLTDEQLGHVDALLNDFWKEYPVDQMLDDTIPVYQKHLTKQDVASMTEFYSSATGKKLLDEMPAIMTESMQAMMPHLQDAMDKMMDRIERKAREEEAAKPPTVKN